MEMVRAGVHKTSVLSVITNFLSLLEPVDVKDWRGEKTSLYQAYSSCSGESTGPRRRMEFECLITHGVT